MLHAALLTLVLVGPPALDDADGDGLSDALEAKLIETFQPKFLLDSKECDGAPAEFEAASETPTLAARNGTIYARVSPSTDVPGQLEIHYFHLWGRDCGPMSPHELDVEHVSALVEAAEGDPATVDAYRALYWYAAAHEDTVCDTSHAAPASVLAAEQRGPIVWISAGKHASYLSLDLCRQRGCGVDSCENPVPLETRTLINLGEADAPLSGVRWLTAADWPLRDKLDNDFDPALRAALEKQPPAVLARVNGQWRATHFSLSVGADIVGGVVQSGEHGGGGVVEAGEQTIGALGKAFRALGSALGLTRDRERQPVKR